jgi:hypothetical protein
MSDADGIFVQRPDGSYEPARPLGWQGGLDWEVRTLPNGRRRAELFDEDMLLAVIESRWRPVLYWRMGRKARRLRAGRDVDV